jgi:imidazole glycerol phosphate synthase glutamine amidotransferase subunit
MNQMPMSSPKGPGNMATSVELVDVGGGNIGSMSRFLEQLGVVCNVIKDATELSGTMPMVLSGVGSFAAVMGYLRDNYFADKLVDMVRNGKCPYLGIGVGMHILFNGSEESPGIPGLHVLDGEIVKFRSGKTQIGSNQVTPVAAYQRYFSKPEYCYFVNAYIAKPTQPEIICLTASFMEKFAAGVMYKNVTGFQFQPEKSGDGGVRLMKAWLTHCGTT